MRAVVRRTALALNTAAVLARSRRRVRGRGNVVSAPDAFLSGVRLDIVGDFNRVTVGAGARLNDVTIVLRGDHNTVKIGPRCRFTRGAEIWLDEGSTVAVAGDSTFERVHLAATEAGTITIGSGCMFATDIEVRTGDSHSVLDAASGRRLNPGADVWIGDHVWVAARALVLKGVVVLPDSIVAAGSVLTRSCPTGGVVLAGNPARPVRSGVTWARERLPAA